MNKEHFDKMIDELIESCFEIESGDYYCDRCLEFDDVLKILQNYINEEKCIECIHYSNNGAKHCDYDNPYPNSSFCMARQPDDYCNYFKKR